MTYSHDRSAARLSFTWSTQRSGNDGFVIEECRTEDGTPGGSLEYRKRFGPMPPHVVPQFVLSRRRIVTIAQQRENSIPILDIGPVA